jgi:putative MFS transporter
VIWTFAIMFALLLGLGLFPNAPVWVVVALFGGYMFIAPAANNMQFVYPSEIFETRIRSTGVGFAAAFSRLSAAAATYLLPVVMQNYGVSAILLIMSAFPLLGLGVSLLWAPETKRAQLL